MKASSFLLSMASPVLHNMICGGFQESRSRQMIIEDVNGRVFEELLEVWRGMEGPERELADLLAMASVADRFQISDITAELENFLIQELKVENCGEVLNGSRTVGLKTVEQASYTMALERFEQVSGTAGFMMLDEETVGNLLGDDRLRVSKEDLVLDGLVKWMNEGCREGPRGRELLRKIRFELMDREFLESEAVRLLPEEERDLIRGLLQDAKRLPDESTKANDSAEAGEPVQPTRRRRKRVVEWERYMEDGAARSLRAHGGAVNALAECDGMMCSGSSDGTIRVWTMAKLEQERVLYESAGDCVYALAVWGKLLISGHDDGRLRVWDVRAGVQRGELDGQWDSIMALCVWGSLLASGTDDGVITVWKLPLGQAAWACELKLTLYGGDEPALVGWEERLVSGFADGRVSVHDLATGKLDASLAGHRGRVTALLVHGERLYSASVDGTVTAWAVGTWTVISRFTVSAIDDAGPPDGTEQRCFGHPCLCLAAAGTALVSGHEGVNGRRGALRVWGEDAVRRELQCEHTLWQQEGVGCLATASWGVVWGGVVNEVVVWGQA